MKRRGDDTERQGMVDLTASVGTIQGIGPGRMQSLADAGIRSVGDLLLSLPFRYEDRSRWARIADLTPGARATVSGQIISSTLQRTRVRGFTIFRARIEDESGALSCLWYNQPYLRNLLKEGRSVALFGDVTLPDRGKPEIRLQNPQVEVLGDDPDRIHTGRIVPVYRKVGDLSCRRVRGIIHRLLQRLPPDLSDPLPSDLSRRQAFPSRAAALEEVHFPPPDADLELLNSGRTPAHRRLAFEEIFALQAALARSRRARFSKAGIPLRITPEMRRSHLGMLPFSLTGAQERVLEEIMQDLSGPSPMGRLLQGEVGSGKTVVALLAAAAVMEHGCQVALMAPTETLAEQHFQTLGSFLAGTRFRTALLTSGLASPQRRKVLGGLADGTVDLVVGTHALIQKKVSFRKLGLAVVDEQHRFGVRQRAALQEKGGDPHFLLMTATPIPRSLALAFYGDMEVSVLDEVPRGRGSVRTVVRRDADRDKIYAFLCREAEQGRRTAIVHPLVRESAGRDLRSAVREAESLARGPLAGLRVGLLHGKLSSEERSRTMGSFATGEIQVLVTTTVVEVGIDVPEASVMVVEHAERFGLSQLHQLRGRVGRGPADSWCILMRGDRISPEAEARLGVITGTHDGFEVARRDLEMRGPGELRGYRQSGDPGLRIARLDRDEDLLDLARNEVARQNAGSCPAPERRRPPSRTTGDPRGLPRD